MRRVLVSINLTRACTQLLSRLKPYHTIKDDFRVPRSITGGLVPSLKPEKPYAPPCLNEHLWNVVRSCWSQLDFRPTSTRLLNELNRLMEQKLVDTSPITPDRNSIDFDGTLPDWPEKIEDFGSLRGGAREEVVSSSRRAEVRVWVISFAIDVFKLSGLLAATPSANQFKLSTCRSLIYRSVKVRVQAPRASVLQRMLSKRHIPQDAKTLV